jgi:DNA topoisomerase-1
VVREFDGPPPPAVVLGVLPPLEQPDLASCQEDRQAVEGVVGPDLLAAELTVVELQESHRRVLPVPFEVGARHQRILLVTDLDLCVRRGGVYERTREPPSCRTTGELEAVHCAIVAADGPSPIHGLLVPIRGFASSPVDAPGAVSGWEGGDRGKNPVMGRLRRSCCDGPGISRRRRGKGFSYHWDQGQKVEDQEVIARIKALAIPPAWKDVWICPWPNGHIQALGTDAAGRRQYRYHDRWRELRDEAKFERLLDFGRRLPDFRQTVTADLSVDGTPIERACATAARLLDTASLRVGGEEYANDNETYGLATLLKEHVNLKGDCANFVFTSKTHQEVRIRVQDRQVAEVLRILKRRRGGGRDLLAWRQGSRWRDLRSDDINDYIKSGLGTDFSAKDFRTWNATVLAAQHLAELDPRPVGERARRAAVAEVVKRVADHLHNTPAVCRKSYIDPRAIDYFHRGEVVILPEPGPADREELEAAVLALLEGTGGREPASVRSAA